MVKNPYIQSTKPEDHIFRYLLTDRYAMLAYAELEKNKADIQTTMEKNREQDTIVYVFERDEYIDLAKQLLPENDIPDSITVTYYMYKIEAKEAKFNLTDGVFHSPLSNTPSIYIPRLVLRWGDDSDIDRVRCSTISIFDLTMYHKRGILKRGDAGDLKKPCIKCEYVSFDWFTNNKKERENGPSIITFENFVTNSFNGELSFDHFNYDNCNDEWRKPGGRNISRERIKKISNQFDKPFIEIYNEVSVLPNTEDQLIFWMAVDQID